MAGRTSLIVTGRGVFCRYVQVQKCLQILERNTCEWVGCVKNHPLRFVILEFESPGKLRDDEKAQFAEEKRKLDDTAQQLRDELDINQGTAQKAPAS